MSWSSSGAERIQTMYGGYCICLVRLISQLSKALDWPMEISAFVQNSWSESKAHLSPYVHAFIRWYILFAINFFHCPQPTYQDIYHVTKSSHSHLKYSAPQLSSSNSPWETLLNTQTSSICKERAKFIASREYIKLTQQRKFIYTEKESDFYQRVTEIKMYLGNKGNMELTLPSSLITTSEILKVTFGFAVPIKTDVSSQTPTVCFQEGRLELWITGLLFVQNWNRQRAEFSLIK